MSSRGGCTGHRARRNSGTAPALLRRPEPLAERRETLAPCGVVDRDAQRALAPNQHHQLLALQSQAMLERFDRRRILRLEAIGIHPDVEDPGGEFFLQEGERAMDPVFSEKSRQRREGEDRNRDHDRERQQQFPQRERTPRVRGYAPGV